MDSTTLAQQIAKFSAEGAAGLGEAERLALVGAAAQLRDALENPVEKVIRIVFTIQEAAILRTSIDMGLIDAAIARGGPATVDELAEKTGADAVLVYRLMRVLAKLGLFQEPEPQVFIPNPIAGAYVTGSPVKEAAIHLSTTLNTVAQLPEYFAKTGYKNPTDANNGPWQYAEKTTDHYWQWLEKQDNRLQNAFNVTMSLQASIRGPSWHDFFPVEDKLKVESPDRTLLVDVGGNKGHDIMAFREKFPNAQGKLVLQDLPQVIDKAQDLPSDIQAVAHDFFTPQPIKDAKAYYMRIVLHDWPDKQASTILSHLRDAMAPDSLLLINEGVVSEKDAPWIEPMVDFHMMTFLGALERTETQWRVLLEANGLEVVKFWEPEDGDGASIVKTRLIEARVKNDVVS